MSTATMSTTNPATQPSPAVAHAVPVEGFPGLYDVEFVEGRSIVGEQQMAGEADLAGMRRDGWDVRIEVSS